MVDTPKKPPTNPTLSADVAYNTNDHKLSPSPAPQRSHVKKTRLLQELAGNSSGMAPEESANDATAGERAKTRRGQLKSDVESGRS